MTSLPAFDRADALARLGSEEFDVLVIGGGITGAGCALDAASRGLRTALVERDDFASGTSSKTSKLVHGGIRYLQQREIRLVYENLRERQLALKNAPHLVRVLPFLIPIFSKDGLIDRRIARALGGAMWMYDLTGGLRIRKRHERITTDEAVAHMPTLRRDKVAGAYLYYDCPNRRRPADARHRPDRGRARRGRRERARGRSGSSKGADGQGAGARVDADGTELEVRARVVVNATGVWSDDCARSTRGHTPSRSGPRRASTSRCRGRRSATTSRRSCPCRRTSGRCSWCRGVTSRTSARPTPTTTARSTTRSARPRTSSTCCARSTPRCDEPVTPADVVGTWAGLRPLLRDRDERAHRRPVTPPRRPCLARAASSPSPAASSRPTGGWRPTRSTRSAGCSAGDRALPHEAPVARRRRRVRRPRPTTNEPSLHEHLAGRYGTEASPCSTSLDDDPELGEPLVPGLPYLRAEAVHAVRHEMARTLDDVLSRRTRARLLARDASADGRRPSRALLAPELGWDEAETQRQVDAYRAAVAHERDSAQLPGDRARRVARRVAA